MKPSIGRIVIYNHMRWDPDGKPPDQSPAIVRQALPSGMVDLAVFGEDGVRTVFCVPQGDEPGQWNWPPRV